MPQLKDFGQRFKVNGFMSQVDNKHIIAQEFIIHEATLKSQAVLGQLMDGLKSLGVLEVMQKISSTFGPLFIHQNQTLDAPTLMSTLSVPTHLSPEKEAGIEMLHKFIMETSELP